MWHNLRKSRRASRWRRFITACAGNVALTFALATPAVVGSVAAGVEYMNLAQIKSQLQQAADTAALAAARELYLGQPSQSHIEALAEGIAKANLAMSGSDATVVADVSGNGDAVTVTASLRHEMLFGKVFGLSDNDISAAATANAVGGGRLCVIALDENSPGVVSLKNSARLNAPTCSVYANSTSSKAVSTSNSALLNAELTCSAGGVSNKGGEISPAALTDCPPVADPLSSRPEPSPGLCTSTDLEIAGGNATLLPGTYCGGILINGNASVTLLPGVYIIKDGSLKVKDSAKLSGEYVGFFFTGFDATNDSSAHFFFDPLTTIDLGAPRDGEMSGILFWQERSASSMPVFGIFSNGARNLLGTIYLPKGQLLVRANNPVADRSAYTAVIANSIAIHDGPEFFLNTNYGATDVPVPRGIGPVGGNIVLTQ